MWYKFMKLVPYLIPDVANYFNDSQWSRSPSSVHSYSLNICMTFGDLLQLHPTSTIKHLETEYLLFQISTDSETSKYRLIVI